MLSTAVVVPLVLLGGAFWIWMIVDCATNEPSQRNDKLVWIIIIVTAQFFIGAAIYYFVRRPKRQMLYGG